MRDEELARFDLRPSPWIIHRWVLGLMGVGYVVFAVAVWGGPHRSGLERALTQVAVIVLGTCVAGFAALASAMVAVFARHRHPLLTAYAATAAIVAVMAAAWTLAP
ncbi:MAG: hypothetical protein IPH44_21485 [Myxococcales bacterium]|nr:hypothetical protein [Myxococcales bacterium]MBP6847055.1 hypothetical protein [Kofleriaceae bacterium]